MTLVTRDRLLTIGMLVLCAVAAFFLLRSDVVEGLLCKWARLRKPKKPEELDFAPHPTPKQHAPHLVVDEQEPHLMLLHDSISSDTSELSDAADGRLGPVVVDEGPTEVALEYKSQFGETVCAPKVPQKRTPRKPRRPSS